MGSRPTTGNNKLKPTRERLAIRSAQVTSEIIQSQRRRCVPNVGTLENPPGSETKEEGPAWMFPELILL